MFQVGDAVSYGTSGVCTIAEQRRRHAMGKQLSSYEDSALREAQNILHSEFAYTLGMDPQQVPQFIAGVLDGASNG